MSTKATSNLSSPPQMHLIKITQINSKKYKQASFRNNKPMRSQIPQNGSARRSVYKANTLTENKYNPKKMTAKNKGKQQNSRKYPQKPF